MSQIQLKRGSADSWTTQNPTLAEGQIGLEKHSPSLYDTNGYNIKIGDGSTTWNNLPYFDGNLQYLTNDSSTPLNLNTVTDPGDYILQYTGSPTLITNKPSVLNSTILWPVKLKVKKIDNTSLLQEIYAIMPGVTPAYQSYQRCTKNGSSWSSWAVISGSGYDITSIDSKINTINSTLNNFEWGQVGTDAGSQPTITHTGAATDNLSLSYFKAGKHVTVWGQMPSFLNTVTGMWTINNALPYPIVPSNYQQLIFIGANCIGVLRYNNGNPTIQPVTSWMSTNWEPAADTVTWNLSYWIINFSYISTF